MIFVNYASLIPSKTLKIPFIRYNEIQFRDAKFLEFHQHNKI
jgi:hypothetical protein